MLCIILEVIKKNTLETENLKKGHYIELKTANFRNEVFPELHILQVRLRFIQIIYMGYSIRSINTIPTTT